MYVRGVGPLAASERASDSSARARRELSYGLGNRYQNGSAMTDAWKATNMLVTTKRPAPFAHVRSRSLRAPPEPDLFSTNGIFTKTEKMFNSKMLSSRWSACVVKMRSV